MNDARSQDDGGRRNRLGATGERLAANYLKQQDFRIIDWNVHRREGVVDLIAVEPTTEALVFVEVKLRKSRGTGSAIEALCARKEARLLALDEVYASEHPELPADLRLNLLAIDLVSNSWSTSLERITHA
jgi:putative endonuclease